MPIVPSNSVDAGQAVYSPLVLGFYDLWVLGVSNHLLWRCPTRDLRALYDRNVSERHIDVGVGTGYYLDKVPFPAAAPEITLLDLNANSLAAAARRIARYRPKAVQADALHPWPVEGPCKSAGLMYLLHCLPGSMAEKAILFDRAAAVLEPSGRLFGATIVQGRAPRSWAAQTLMDVYNRQGIFANTHDTIEDLDHQLGRRFPERSVRLEGCVALFEAVRPA